MVTIKITAFLDIVWWIGTDNSSTLTVGPQIPLKRWYTEYEKRQHYVLETALLTILKWFSKMYLCVCDLTAKTKSAKAEKLQF